MWEKQNKNENFNINGIIFGQDLVSREEKNDKQLFVMMILQYFKNHIGEFGFDSFS